MNKRSYITLAIVVFTGSCVVSGSANGDWLNDVIDLYFFVGGGYSLAMNPVTNMPALAYLNPVDLHITYVEYTGTGWTVGLDSEIELVDDPEAELDISQARISLAFNSAGEPAMAFSYETYKYIPGIPPGSHTDLVETYVKWLRRVSGVWTSVDDPNYGISHVVINSFGPYPDVPAKYTGFEEVILVFDGADVPWVIYDGGWRVMSGEDILGYGSVRGTFLTAGGWALPETGAYPNRIIDEFGPTDLSFWNQPMVEAAIDPDATDPCPQVVYTAFRADGLKSMKHASWFQLLGGWAVSGDILPGCSGSLALDPATGRPRLCFWTQVSGSGGYFYSKNDTTDWSTNWTSPALYADLAWSTRDNLYPNFRPGFLAIQPGTGIPWVAQVTDPPTGTSNVAFVRHPPYSAYASGWTYHGPDEDRQDRWHVTHDAGPYRPNIVFDPVTGQPYVVTSDGSHLVVGQYPRLYAKVRTSDNQAINPSIYVTAGVGSYTPLYRFRTTVGGATPSTTDYITMIPDNQPAEYYSVMVSASGYETQTVTCSERLGVVDHTHVEVVLEPGKSGCEAEPAVGDGTIWSSSARALLPLGAAFLMLLAWVLLRRKRAVAD